MMRKTIPVCGLLLAAVCWPARGADRDFETLTGAIEGRLGVHRTHIPGLGVAKFFVRAAAPSGAHGFQLATFEDLSYSPETLRDFHTVVANALGPAWQPMVQVQAPARKEYTGIFVRGQGGRLRMMITTIEAREATVIEMKVSPLEWLDWLREPGTMGKRAGGTNRNEGCCEEE